MEEEKRIGNFTSSEIYKLIPMGSVPMTKEELADFKVLNPKLINKRLSKFSNNFAILIF